MGKIANMKLREALYEILKTQPEPYTFNEIARKFNNSELISTISFKELKAYQVKNIVNKEQSIFTNFNGYVVLKEDSKWNNLLRTYFSLIDSTRGILNVSEQEFVVTALFFTKD
ncbi:hypothetical protein LZ575_14535 [Antarcticibacterium sp. 1MA-6-2]|uniref:hypothetical protein n=1 Tax=Antarcticibacterium sp. 1MA-6-2 TaxID=2908210 RepID=UPI001F40C11A|nr:hypothetical protein [Antarcticibacterium sp. 1MA-6-2]UJH90123.1 hypothetical protein LZ575_14535 [Antarcticibacterium sp. 1MA-6-2]